MALSANDRSCNMHLENKPQWSTDTHTHTSLSLLIEICHFSSHWIPIYILCCLQICSQGWNLHVRCVQSDESLIMSLSIKIRVPHQPHGYPLVDQHRRGPTMCRSLGKPWLLSTSMLVDKIIMLDLRIHDYLKYLPCSGTPTYPITLLLHIRNIPWQPPYKSLLKIPKYPKGLVLIAPEYPNYGNLKPAFQVSPAAFLGLCLQGLPRSFLDEKMLALSNQKLDLVIKNGALKYQKPWFTRWFKHQRWMCLDKIWVADRTSVPGSNTKSGFCLVAIQYQREENYWRLHQHNMWRFAIKLIFQNGSFVSIDVEIYQQPCHQTLWIAKRTHIFNMQPNCELSCRRVRTEQTWQRPKTLFGHTQSLISFHLHQQKTTNFLWFFVFHHRQEFDSNGITISPTRTKTWTYWPSYSSIKLSIVLDTTHISIHFINSSTSDHKFKQKNYIKLSIWTVFIQKNSKSMLSSFASSITVLIPKKIEKWFTINHLSGSLLFHLSVDYPLVN